MAHAFAEAAAERAAKTNAMGAVNDVALDRAFAARERWAFDEAYARYVRLLYAAAYGVLHVREEAEDCVHDALARVWNNPAAYAAPRGSVRSFLAVCVRNEAISRARKAATRRGAELRAASTDRAEDPELPDFIERDRLRRAIAALPGEQREALILAYYEGKTHVEIAQLLNAPLGTVKGRLALAVRKLGRMMQEPAS